jgi:hypothetical protein
MTIHAELEAYVREALRLNGITLSERDLTLVIAEFGRAREIVEPLLGFDLPDRLDLAAVFRP